MWPFIRSRRSAGPQYAQRAFQSLETFNHDGLVLARVRRTRRRSAPGLRPLMLFALAVFAFKIFLFMHLGEVAYTQKMLELSEGGQIEHLAGRAMQLDPVSTWIVDGLRFGTW